MAFELWLIKGCSSQPDADFLTMALSPILSEVGSVKRQR